jgi:hypothetical protein
MEQIQTLNDYKYGQNTNMERWPHLPAFIVNYCKKKKKVTNSELKVKP